MPNLDDNADMVLDHEDDPDMEAEPRTCPHCNGSGEGWHEGWICRHCNGKGEIHPTT